VNPQKFQFSNKEAIKFGWNTTKSNLKFFILLFLIFFAVLFGLPLIEGIFVTALKQPTLASITRIIGNILTFLMLLGLSNISLKFVENDHPKYSDLFSVYPLFLKYLAASIMFFLLVWLGGLLIIPGFYFFAKYQFYVYFILTLGNKVGPLKALQLSAKITEGTKLNLINFYLLSSLIVAAGVLLFGVGLFIAVPTVVIAHAYIFKKLLSQTQSIAPSSRS